jgi:SAM-dependent methyltransferase
MHGIINGLNVLMDGTSPYDLYSGLQLMDKTTFFDILRHSSTFFDIIAHKKPNLRVLEIGAGVGGTKANVLSALQSVQCECIYLSYTSTDISPGFFQPAQARFHELQGKEY